MPQIEEFPAIEEFPTEDELRASLGGEGTPIPRSPEELAMQNFAARGGTSAGDVRPPGSGIIPEFRAPTGASLPVKVGAGILNTAGSVGNFFLSPEGVATMLAPEIVGPKIAAPVAKALFGGLMAKSAGEMAGKASVTGDAQDVTEAALAGLGAGLAGLHGSLPPKPEGFIGPIATGESLPMPRGSPAWRRPAFQLPDAPKFEETKPVEPESPIERVGLQGNIPVQKLQSAFQKFVSMQEMTPEEEALVNRAAREQPELYNRLEELYPVEVPGVEPIPEGKVTTLGPSKQQLARREEVFRKLAQAISERESGKTPEKEPWQMTKAEYSKARDDARSKIVELKDAIDAETEKGNDTSTLSTQIEDLKEKYFRQKAEGNDAQHFREVLGAIAEGKITSHPDYPSLSPKLPEAPPVVTQGALPPIQPIRISTELSREVEKPTIIKLENKATTIPEGVKKAAGTTGEKSETLPEGDKATKKGALPSVRKMVEDGTLRADSPARFSQTAGPFKDEVIVTRSAKQPGKWQATLLKDQGEGGPLEPSGDVVFDTWEKAVRSALGEEVDGKTAAGSKTFNPHPTPPPPIYKSIEGAKVEQEAKPTIPVWKVSYTDLETRAAKRPFFKHTAEVEAPTRKEAIEKVQAYHGNPSKWGEFRASKAPEGTKPMFMFRHIPEEPLPPPTPPPAAAKVQSEVAKVAATEGQRSAKEVKAELSKRIQDEIDALPKTSTDLNIQQVGPKTTRGKKTLEYVAFPGDRIILENFAGKWSVFGEDYYTPPGTKQPITIRQYLATSLDLKDAKKLAESTLRDNGGNFPWNPDKPITSGPFNKEIKVNWDYFTGKSGKAKTVTIDIPGDGTFTIPKTRFALEEMQKRVKAIQTGAGTPPEVPVAGPDKDLEVIRGAKQAQDYYKNPIIAAATIRRQLKQGDFTPEQIKFSEEIADRLENQTQEHIQDLRLKLQNAKKRVEAGQAAMKEYEEYPKKYGPLSASQARLMAQTEKSLVVDQKDAGEYESTLNSLLAEKAKHYENDWTPKEPTPAPPAATGEGMPPGPGAQTAGTDQPTGAQIEQLSQAFRQITAEKTPFLQKVKEAFDLGKKRELSQNLIARTLSALKTSGDYLIQTWQGQRQLDPILRAKGELSAELETRGWRLRQAMKDMKRAVSSKAVREAISKYVDAGGDVEKLRQSAESVPAGRRAPYIRAMQLTPDEKIIAGHIRSFFDARLQEAMDAGVLSHGVEDYLHRIYPKDTTWRRGVINAVQNALLDTRTPGLAKQRVFQLDAEAERAGHLPVNDFIPRIIDYEASLSKVIASRAAVKRFTEIKMPDGRPMLDVSGIGVPIENAEGIREATLIKPSFRPGEKQLDDSGKPTKNYRLDYQSRDYPALKKWKWATNDAEGKPIFVQGDVLVHPDAVHRVDALLEPSKVKRYAAARAALTVGSVFKQTMLDFSGFHQVQIAIHGLEHKVNPFRLVKDVDTNNPDIQGLLKGGMTLGGQHVGGIYEEGLAGRSLSRQIPGLGELMQSYHDWLFQDFIPRVKTTMAIHALERNKARFAKELASGQMKPEALYHQTAKEANAAFGEQNYIMLERSKTAQDMARLILLAPDFLESRARFALQAGTRLGGEQRMALLLGALTLYTTARIMNKAINDEWHFEPENMFSVIYNGKSYSVRTVQGDILHLMESPVRFWMHRLNPTITRPLFELMTQRDEFGRKRSFWQVLGDTISNVVPISMRNSREQSIWTSMLNAFGGSVRRDSDVGRVYQEAAKWKAKNGIRTEPGEFIYDSSKDVYRPLKLALLDGNTEGAAKEYQKLIASKAVTPSQAIRHFQSYANAPFSGSKANEQRFVQSLTKDQRHAYEGAKQEKQRVLREFLKARQLVPGSQGTIPSFVPTVQQR